MSGGTSTGAGLGEAPLPAASHEVPQFSRAEGEGRGRSGDQQGPEYCAFRFDHEELLIVVELEVCHELARVEPLEFEKSCRRAVLLEPRLTLAALRRVLLKFHAGGKG